MFSDFNVFLVIHLMELVIVFLVLKLHLVMIVAAIANVFRLRRLLGDSFDGIGNCFPGIETTFGGAVALVARFNFVKNSLVINFGSFNNGMYVPSSKIKKNSVFFFINKM